ncbi:unnamed protein product, partial [Mesorhabditis belari]|uniref:Uncharacterized protein n=1 Tax=Mesorhabditis belari TaxID=2138241 RepID=A0AAF3EDY7_9BILA
MFKKFCIKWPNDVRGNIEKIFERKRMFRSIFFIFTFIFSIIALQIKLDLKGVLKDVLNDLETQNFANYMAKWKKNYNGNETELKRRANIWKQNKADIDAENAIADGYTCGENMFTDMDKKERKNYVMDANLADQADASIKKLATRAKRGAQMTYVGETIDWRQPAYMPPVRDQGQCGSCYAFAAINAIEVQWNWLGHSLSQFSEQQIIDCSGTNNGCNGGWPEKVFNYSIYYGNAPRASYPYKGVKGTCYNTARTMTVSTWYQLTTVSQMESYNYYYGAVAFSGL